MFADSAKITIRSGKGGDGHVSFRRELYVAAGGPDGGDGGRGGDLIFEVDPRVNTLNDFRHIRKYFAGDGEPGGKRRCHGADGEDMVVHVPEGTVVREAETGKVIIDMSHEHKREIVLKGGRELEVILELKTIADVGLIGFPNVGKSTFLSRVSNAKPKIANYHFTTLSPILGVVDLEGTDGFVIADIPGLIEGASEGVGLGHEFLRHIERTKLFIHMVDAASTEGRDPLNDILIINKELENYSPELIKRPQVIAANKTDVFYGTEEDTVITLLKEEFEPKGIPVFPISAVSGKGVKELLYYVKQQLDQLDQEPVVFEQEYDLEQETFKDEPYTVEYDEKEGMYVVEGPRIERMLGYTNLDSEKGFEFFQKFLRTSGIVDELEKLGIEEGDTVRMYGLQFDYLR